MASIQARWVSKQIRSTQQNLCQRRMLVSKRKWLFRVHFDPLISFPFFVLTFLILNAGALVKIL